MRRSLPTHAPTTATSSSSTTTTTTSWFTRLHQGHERLKRSVHEGMRVPLPAAGRRFMGVVYFVTPIIGGYYVMQWAIAKSHASIGVHGEFLPTTKHNKDENEVGQPQTSRSTLGVPLAAAPDAATQRRNQKKLDRFLQQQFKKAGVATVPSSKKGSTPRSSSKESVVVATEEA